MSFSWINFFKCGAKTHRFQHAYQPIVNTKDKTIYGYESLLRGAENEHPSEVLGAVGRRRMVRFDQFNRACSLERLAELGLSTRVSLNFTSSCLVDSKADVISETLEEAIILGFDPGQIIFEICESEVVHGVVGLREVLDRIRSAGALIVLDDFGAGFAGINSLIDTDPDILKLDRYMVSGIETSGIRQSAVKSIFSLTKSMGIELIAEGVETEEEVNCLADLGIHLFQGYFFAKPAVSELTTPKGFNQSV